ncbi:MAG: dTMP kinase [Chloroflexota bacterium]|nr:dTMP kinase [Chloroflexota bacterium]
MALFVAFEGGEGSGKSTQARSLSRRLSRRGFPVLLTHEPGGTPLGDRLRRYLKGHKELSPLAELFLFAAARAQLVEQVIRPRLVQGSIVLCDRYAASTVAYQGGGRGLDAAMVESVNRWATQGLQPHLVILLDLPVEEGLRRKGLGNGDRFEREALDFHRRVREGYLKLAAAAPTRWLVVDATLPPRKVADIIWERVQRMLERQHLQPLSPKGRAV